MSMKANEFKEWLEDVPSLSKSQRSECLMRLKEGTPDKGKGDMPQAIAEAVPECCPHCQHQEFTKWGYASNLQRWRCKSCSKTFNALTSTPLAHLRKKEKWLDHAKSMIAGDSLRKTAAKCDVHFNTCFRWRHRFLSWQQQAQCTNLSGIAECDQTYFYRSEKGKKNSIASLANEEGME